MPPALLTASSASLAPLMAYPPDSAAGPVTGAHMPILMVAPCALAMLLMIWGAFIPATIPAAKSRLVSFINLSLRPGFVVGLSLFWHPHGTHNRSRITDSLLPRKLISRRVRLTTQTSRAIRYPWMINAAQVRLFRLKIAIQL